MLAVHAVTLLPLPVCPGSARHPLSATVVVAVPVPELVGHAPQSAADWTSALNVSSAQAVTPAPCPLKPATPTQSFSSADDTGLLLLLGHVEQATAEALSALYVPAEHSETLLPLPVKPASAKQLPSAAVPELPPVPELDGQAVQAAEPEASLNVSATHADGVALFGPVYPALARQASTAVAPESSPVPELDGQAVQLAEPKASLNVSAKHATHDPDVPVEPDRQL